MIRKYLVLVRPHQWFKQSIVVAPILSLGQSISLYDLALGFSAAMTFTFPIRKKRPLAAGTIAKQHLKFILLLLAILSLICNFILSQNVKLTSILLCIYAALNFVYSKFNLKKHSLLGVSMVAIGFPLRFAFGCWYLDISISYWALVLLMQLALFMLSVKRYQRHLRRSYGINDSNSQNPEFWLLAAIIFAAFFSASYAGFVSAPSTQAVWGSSALLLSAIPIALAIVRYLGIAIQVKNWNSHDITDTLLKDFPLVCLVIIYATIMLVGSVTNA
jgi:hypothetical protein